MRDKLVGAENAHNQTTEIYPEFDKIARLSRECTITEKIDGTNGLDREFLAVMP